MEFHISHRKCKHRNLKTQCCQRELEILEGGDKSLSFVQAATQRNQQGRVASLFAGTLWRILERFSVQDSRLLLRKLKGREDCTQLGRLRLWLQLTAGLVLGILSQGRDTRNDTRLRPETKFNFKHQGQEEKG